MGATAVRPKNGIKGEEGIGEVGVAESNDAATRIGRAEPPSL